MRTSDGHCNLIMRTIFLLAGIAAASSSNPAMQKRQAVDSYCTANSSICGFFTKQYNECNSLVDALTFIDKFTACYCKNGGVAAQIGCHYCETSFGESELSDPEFLSSECASLSIPVAPLPSSLMSEWAQFNATFVGEKPSDLQVSTTTDSQAGASALATGLNVFTASSSTQQTESSSASIITSSGAPSTSSNSLVDSTLTSFPSGTSSSSLATASSASSTSLDSSFSNAAAASTGGQSSSSSGQSMGEHRSDVSLLLSGALVVLLRLFS
ncbi:hypothetical protein Q7P37_007497 [Cladosporium fusiforme]